MITVSLSKKIIFGFFLLQMQFDTLALNFKSIKFFLKKHKTLITLSMGFGLGVCCMSYRHQRVLIELNQKIKNQECKLREFVGKQFHMESLKKTMDELYRENGVLKFAQTNLAAKLAKHIGYNRRSVSS